ncbi:hypothetical protein SCHPADRAFT_597461 [Schizopora paradoxa]|uniref:AAA+ ATPase domain-containing protein n=1 Tax=Schizopora paradoxa TaxID=27342 RepID=A0A0H2RBE5_9AGAM|nr:hypothetical protein SCHPADRAFT_597461 [Schizopora paradoxa]
MESYSTAARRVDLEARGTLHDAPLLSLIYNIVYDLAFLIYTLLSGKLTIGELWLRILGIPVPQTTSNKIDEEIQVDKELESAEDGHDADTIPSQAIPASADEQAISAKSYCAVSGLCRAIVNRDVDLVAKILAAAPSLAARKHLLGFYPLTAALLSGEPAIVRLILAQPGVSIVCAVDKSFDDDNEILRAEFSSNANHTRVRKATALHYACMTSNPEMVKIMCQLSDDFITEDYYNKAPIDYIDSTTEAGVEALGIFDSAHKLWSRNYILFQSVSLDRAAKTIFRKDLTLFDSLLKRSPEIVNEQDGWTILHVAVMNQYLPFVERIIKVDPATVNVRGWRLNDCIQYTHALNAPYSALEDVTPLHLACLVGNLELAEMLLKAGADWTIKDHSRSDRTAHDVVLEMHGEELASVFKRMCDEEEARKKAEKDAKKAEPADSTTKDKDTSEDKKEVASKPPASDSNSSSSSSSDSGESDHEKEKEDEEDEESRTAKALDLERIIGAKIIGQRGPVRSVASAIRLRENGWVDPDRPLVMLFLGSSGVGKTELAKQIALYIHEKSGTDLDAGQSITELETDFKFVRIDMSEYQHKHTVSNLTGPPKGYVGYDEEGFLTKRLRKCPRAIVLLDEIEKAHPDVLTVFLQVFDDGRITDTKRGVIYCQNAVFIMTSNLASDEIKKASPMLRKLVEQTEDRPEEYTRVVGEFNRGIHPILKESLRRDEFLGRINQIVVFLPLNEDEISIVIGKELTTWKKRAAEKHSIELTWSSEVVKKLTQSYDINFGVRSVVHEVQRIAVQQVAEAQIRGFLKKNYLAHLTTNELGDIELRGEPRVGLIPARRACRLHLH